LQAIRPMPPPPYPFHPPLRVLMTADTIGGVWTYALDLARGLATHGVHLLLATLGAPVSRDQRAQLETLGDAVELHESDFKLEWMDDPWSDVTAAGDWLLSLEREFQPDIIHLNGYAHGALPFHAPKLVVAHSCVISWWRAVKNTAPPHTWARYHTAVRLGLDQAHLIVAPSQAMLGSLLRNYGFSCEARVIYNGRDHSAALQPARPKQPFILSAARLWDEAKNATTLAAAAQNLPWPVRIAGDTRAPDGSATSFSSFPNVGLLGRRSHADLDRDYAHASVYALPARYEPFGLSVLEAALHDCALVLGDIPSLREIWSGAAVFVPPNDASALHDELAELIEDPLRLQALGTLARRRAAHFTVERMTDAYLDAYAALLAPTRPRTHAASVSFA